MLYTELVSLVCVSTVLMTASGVVCTSHTPEALPSAVLLYSLGCKVDITFIVLSVTIRLVTSVPISLISGCSASGSLVGGKFAVDLGLAENESVDEDEDETYKESDEDDMDEESDEDETDDGAGDEYDDESDDDSTEDKTDDSSSTGCVECGECVTRGSASLVSSELLVVGGYDDVIMLGKWLLDDVKRGKGFIDDVVGVAVVVESLPPL